MHLRRQFTDISVDIDLTRRTYPSHIQRMDDLLREIEAFCAANHIRESRFGRDAVNDTAFIPQLRSGREPRRATVAKVRHFMATYGQQEAA